MNEEQKKNEDCEEVVPEIISPWYLYDIIMPIIKEEFIATTRYDRTGIRIKFCNGQKFHLTINEIK